ncbi:uncharacterized protein B0I36DRAFT_313700 [Microdochium trichocladiopsis]|uniref:Uncharacterized protein n=1 Tax=Microdochium trichocladiopsis TaxID=1682393 RepID=A0A9P8YFW6_9PEZI|nr:uncharacterized protein B0I36DRAFT_313700 [Microdochium trichocladiopsis]KAH7037290.1 hypothetical protein B0I36DRAFT_313700 [Microdochium trichocladiopsis]
MVCLSSPSFFQRRTRAATLQSGKIEIKHPHYKQLDMEEQALRTHARLYSMTSSNSRSSSESDDSSRAHSFNPLQSHPPLQINASPIIETRFMGNDDRGEFHQAQSKINEEFAILDEDDLDDSRPSSSRRMTYVYDEGSQWPLKDWQTIPPGLADPQESSEFATALRPRPANHQRRPTEWRDDPDLFIKRGSWKRRGIIFNPDVPSDDENVEHFELPEE